MTQTVQEWANRLSADPLPVLQRTLTLVRDLLHKSNVNHSGLSEIISRDPGFSLYLMQRLGGLPNPPKEPVARISLAIPLLGMGLIEQAGRTLPCLEDKLKGPPRRGLIDCYSRAAHAAFYARGLVELQGQSDGDELYTGALLHDLGEMALWSADPELMGGIQRKVIDGDDRENAALEILGFTLEELSLQLSTKWRLPELIRDAQGLANSYLPKPLTVMLASALARETSLGWDRTRTLDDIELLAEFLEIPQDRANACLHRLSAEAGRSLNSLPLPLPAFYLIGGEGNAIRRNAPLRPEWPAEPQVGKSPPITVQAASDPQPPPAPGKRVNPLQELLNGAIRQMHNELGLSRVMFAMFNPDKTILKARFVIESEQQLSLKSFTLNTNKPSLFTQLLKKPQAISFNKGNADKYLPMIPGAALEQINPSGFITMSVFIHNRPIGLFYADNGLSGPGVTRRQYENFKVICRKTIQAFSH